MKYFANGFPSFIHNNPANIYHFKVNKWNPWKRSEICSSLTIKAPERRQWRCSSVCSHHVNWNSIIYRNWAVHRIETERPLLSAIGFNTNLVHFLPQHVLISKMYVCSFTGTISHMHGRATKMGLCVQNFVYKKS